MKRVDTIGMTTMQIVEALAEAIDGRSIVDRPGTEDLLWAFFYRCAHEGAEVAVTELTPEDQ